MRSALWGGLSLECMLRSLGVLAGISILAFLAPVALRAQSGRGTILGRVTDQSGAIVQGATVTVHNKGTNISAQRKTNNDGEYAFSNLIPGTYAVTVQQPGFESFSVNHIVLSVSQTVREDATLTVGKSVSTVQVSAQAPIVQTDTSSVGSVVDTKQIQSMPLNGRSTIFGLLALAPGVQNSGNTPRIAGATTLGSYNETVDGTSALEPENGYLGTGVPSLDSIAEFKVVDSMGSAKSGTGAVSITIVTKSGTNQFHGSAFEYNRVAALDAKNFFATGLPKPPFVRNEFGGSLGGPIKRNKLFFFGSFEGLTYRSSATREGAMPTEALLNGDFSGLPPITDPETGQPFLNNQIPAARISSVSKGLFPYFDTPNLASSSPAGLGTNWVGNVGIKQNEMRYEGRIDYTINDKNQLSGRYYTARYTPNDTAGTTDKWGGEIAPHIWQNYALHYIRNVSPSLMNSASFGYNRVWDRNKSQNTNLDASKLVPGLTPPIAGLGGLPDVSITGFTGLGDWTGSGDTEQTYQASDDLTWMKGKHLIQAGISFMHWQFYNFQNPSLGSFSFTGRYTGDAFADFLLGDLAGSSRPIAPLSATPTNDRYGFYIQDDWKVTPRLTLNLGLRYDLPTLFQNTQGNMANWYPDINKLVILKGKGDLSSYHNLPIIEGSTIGLGPGNYIGTDNTQIAPRFGLAYRPFKSSALVIRGGYGLYYQKIPWAFGSYELAVNPPFTGEESFEPLSESKPTLTFANAFPAGEGGIPSGVSVSAYPVHYKYPMTGEWNFTVESQISSQTAIRATYLGAETEHLTQNFNINDPPPASGPVQPRRPYQPFGPIHFYENGLTASTQSLQLSVRRRFSNGLSLEAQYAWTKMLDAGASLYGVVPTDNRNIRLDRGNDGSIRQQYFVGNYVYDLPFGRGRRFLSHLSKPLDLIWGGWQTTGILTLGSGLPYSVNFSSHVEGWPSSRADIIGDPTVDHPTLDRWFDPAAFTVPQPFTYGNSAPNSLFGPGFANWDTSISKQFLLTERYKLTFTADFFNALNHPNFNRPASNISVPSQVGRITSAGSPRNIQFSLRLEF
ncbi:MAG: TonB-dependent receptor domain-containing protein [Bryobacteraceae bacterium]